MEEPESLGETTVVSKFDLEDLKRELSDQEDIIIAQRRVINRVRKVFKQCYEFVAYLTKKTYWTNKERETIDNMRGYMENILKEWGSEL